MTWYCDVAPGHPVHQDYHDKEYGFPKTDERALFELLCLEIFQAGLNWELVLKKRAGMVEAFEGFAVDRVADYTEADRARLLSDARIIRNALKVNAMIHNAGVIRTMRDSHGGFAAWLAAHHPLNKADWVKLFKQTFKFTGGEITNEFLMCIGYLPGAHRESCPVFAETKAADAPWMAVDPLVYKD
ncbi:DNA-3-methyladenine glycosylase I [Magnetospira sp. QH-2]|uniref:DNA-3-methyladenine glycosylase I n=1 Tax=Magnetospira sp. (strain QH-2) TaxID=1288970 RepID=UPI0003E81620|nr:DNA-3-methyladenine glycosylase I [Magnetospira sp. QH-2]CCQ73687.1 3-methyladenine DNA glycosylase [Magnetospira sp. QH-2]